MPFTDVMPIHSISTSQPVLSLSNFENEIHKKNSAVVQRNSLIFSRLSPDSRNLFSENLKREDINLRH